MAVRPRERLDGDVLLFYGEQRSKSCLRTSNLGKKKTSCLGVVPAYVFFIVVMVLLFCILDPLGSESLLTIEIDA